MTKVLVWNIQQFGINKINNANNKRPRGQGGLTNQQASQSRRNVILNVLNATDPDIIVIIEVSSGDTYPLDVASFTGGMLGCVNFLNRLRFYPGEWRLVPPMRIGRGGKAESVGVFYRGQSTVGGNQVNRYFTGPNLWTGGINGMSAEPPTLSGPYPGSVNGSPDLNAMIVYPGQNVRQIPAGAQHNATVNENRVAARTFFSINENGVAGDPINYGTFREPYMATFVETDANNNVIRNLSLFGVHSPAVVGDQSVFMTYLANTFEIVAPNAANEVRIVCGDFNLNLLDANGNLSDAYQPLTNNNYGLLLRPNGGPPANVDPYRGYFTTHIKTKPSRGNRTAASKFLWSENNQNQSLYPAYEYVGSRYGGQNNPLYSLDNILVRPYNAATDYRTTVLNTVVGTPFNVVANPPGNPPLGSQLMPSSFTTAANWPPAVAPNFTIGIANNLVSWANYGHVYSTSDHFALYAVV